MTCIETNGCQYGNSLQRNLRTDVELAPKIHGREDWDISILVDFIEKPFVLCSYKKYSLREEQVGIYMKWSSPTFFDFTRLQ